MGELTGHDVLIAGLPRSGTTLTCELLNELPACVALDEPLDWQAILQRNRPQRTLATRVAGRLLRGAGVVRRPYRPPPVQPLKVVDDLRRFLEDTRRSIVSRGIAVSKNINGSVLGSKVSDHFDESGTRVALAQLGEVHLDKELSADFLLAVKDASPFTALLEVLIDQFRVYALVRNPLPVLSSWQTVPFPPRQGHAPMAEVFDIELAAGLARMDDTLDRQFHLLGWFFARFHDVLGRERVVRYEDIVASGGSALSIVTPQAESLRASLGNRNRDRRVYDLSVARELGARLLGTDGPWWYFYSPGDIEELLAD